MTGASDPHTGVGFIGLGIMGRPMAVNLRRAGVPLSVWNRSAEACGALRAEGAEVAASAHDVLRRCRIVVMMLQSAEAIDAVLGPVGARTDALRDTILVNMGTVSPEYSRALADDVAAAGGAFVEAPVSGSRKPAEEAALVGMLAGDPAAVAEAGPVIRLMCASTTYCGEVPAALSMKLAVNVFLLTTVAGLAESFHFAAQQGLDLDVLRTLLDAGQMSSPISRVKTEKLVRGDETAQASIRDALANSVLVTDAARAAGTATPLVDLCRALYAEAADQGAAALDMSSVLRALQARTAAAPEG